MPSSPDASASTSSETVRVVIQTRPLLPFETAHNALSVLHPEQDPPSVHVSRPNAADLIFDSFHAVYPPSITPPDHLISTHVHPLVASLFTGLNATVFAYGQTSAGKSFTMKHVTHAVAHHIFQHKRRLENQSPVHILIRVSFVEIYRETIRDLVDGAAAPLATIQVQVRERVTKSGRHVFLDGAKERCVDSHEQLIDIVREAALLRSTAATGMNPSSSRSHSIITVSVQQEPLDPSDSSTPCLSAKLNLVDLAGSERAKRTGAGGTRFAEGIQINKGLFALAKVISTLAANSSKPKTKRMHVPYRDSKLTRLLQDSLGGNARTLLIACVSPADSSREETVGTLRYAERATKIRNKPKVNQDATAVEVTDLRAALSRMKAENASLAAENERLVRGCCEKCGTGRRIRGSVGRDEEKGVGIGEETIGHVGHLERRENNMGLMNGWKPYISADDVLLQKVGAGDDEEDAEVDEVEEWDGASLHRRMEEMGRTFTARLSQAECDKTGLDRERLRLVTELETEKRRHKVEIESLHKRHASEMGRLQGRVEEWKMTRGDLIRETKTRRQMEGERNRADARCMELTKRLAEEKGRVESHREEMRRERRARGRTKEEVTRLRDEHCRLEGIVQRLRGENGSLRARMRLMERGGRGP